MQDVLDRSAAAAGPHLRRIFKPPTHSLSAEQVASYFTGRKQIAVATVTAGGEPRVAPVDGLLIHGRFAFGTHASSARVRHLRRRPGISLTHFDRDELAIVVHGVAELVDFGQSSFDAVDRAFAEVYGGTPSTLDEGSVYAFVEPRLMFTFVRAPGRL